MFICSLSAFCSLPCWPQPGILKHIVLRQETPLGDRPAGDRAPSSPPCSHVNGLFHTERVANKAKRIGLNHADGENNSGIAPSPQCHVS